jgi:PmbA protein
MSDIETEEFFFIRKELDMQRKKKIRNYDLVLYRDYETRGKPYRGVIELSLHPTLSLSEVRTIIKDGLEKAKYLKNEPFPIPEANDRELPSEIDEEKCTPAADEYIQALFEQDNEKNARINSCEVVFESSRLTIVNSRGIRKRFPQRRIFTELVVECGSRREEVELIDFLNYSDVYPDKVRKDVAEIMFLVKERSDAKPTETRKRFSVVLSRKAVEEFLSFYRYQTWSKLVYQKNSLAKIGESIQGKSPKGDLLTLSMVPVLENNPKSRPYDVEGTSLTPLPVIENGVVKQFWGEKRYAHYLGIQPTGVYPLFKVSPGSLSREILKKRKYVEITQFSDFQTDEITGDFAGEIRLGWHDGVPITGGSVSGNVHQLESSMKWSSDTVVREKAEVPAFLFLENVDILGS